MDARESTRWVALLRGVNVNGITIRSAELRALFEELGAASVRTVLASGNVLFTGTRDRNAWKQRIEQALRDRFGYDAWIVLVGADELAAVAASFPFDAEDPARHPYVVFCADAAVQQEAWDAASGACGADERVAQGEGVVYWHAVVGTSTDSPVARVLGRPRFKSGTTTRNLRTVRRMLA
jgi:uncharacterized protein (DUF1697 family)